MYSLSTSGMAELWFECFEYYHAYRSVNTFNECLRVVLEQKQKYTITTPHCQQALFETHFDGKIITLTNSQSMLHCNFLNL